MEFVCMQKELAEQQSVGNMLGGVCETDRTHPVWADVRKVSDLTMAKLDTLGGTFLSEGMKGVLSQGAMKEWGRELRDSLEAGKGEGLKDVEVGWMRVKSSRMHFT
jgi:hypothetical protein